jgi:DNA-directed RNA polymerase subunit RPC12/RpoP
MKINQCPICGKDFSLLEKQAVADGRECSRCGSFLCVGVLNRFIARLVMLSGALVYFWNGNLIWGVAGVICSVVIINFSKIKLK